MASIYVLFIFCLALLSVLDGWQQHALQTQTDAQNDRLVVAQQRLTHLMAEYPNLDTTKALAALQMAQQKQAVLAAVVASGANFADILKGFSLAVVPNVWLTAIHYTRSDNHIDIDGSSTDPSAVRQFMASLARQPVFTGVAFQLTSLDQGRASKSNGAGGNSFSFHISTKVPVA
jgi:Tfp pilus assembly protein PilN